MLKESFGSLERQTLNKIIFLLEGDKYRYVGGLGRTFFDTGSRISHSHKLNCVSFLPSQVVKPESNKSPRRHWQKEFEGLERHNHYVVSIGRVRLDTRQVHHTSTT